MKITGITKNELEDLMVHWGKFGHCYKWPVPLTPGGRDREEDIHYRERVFYIDKINEVYIKIEPICTETQYYCERGTYYNGQKKAQGLKFLKKIFREGEF